MRESFNGLFSGMAVAAWCWSISRARYQLPKLGWIHSSCWRRSPFTLGGVMWMLFLSLTHLSIAALMGSLMCIGLTAANSILVSEFRQSADGAPATTRRHSPRSAAGYTRLRPVLMTAGAMIVGMIPMALGVGEGGEQNAPLARADGYRRTGIRYRGDHDFRSGGLSNAPPRHHARVKTGIEMTSLENEPDRDASAPGNLAEATSATQRTKARIVGASSPRSGWCWVSASSSYIAGKARRKRDWRMRRAVDAAEAPAVDVFTVRRSLAAPAVSEASRRDRRVGRKRRSMRG